MLAYVDSSFAWHAYNKIPAITHNIINALPSMCLSLRIKDCISIVPHPHYTIRFLCPKRFVMVVVIERHSSSGGGSYNFLIPTW